MRCCEVCSQNNMVFQKRNHCVPTGKTPQIKPRQSEQGEGVEITLGEYDNCE